MKIYAKKLTNKRAQQLVEFLIVAPLIVVILGIVTEYAYALSINLTLEQGLKYATANIYKSIKPGMTEADIVANVQSDLSDYITDNMIPIDGSGVSVSGSINDINAFFTASLSYKTAFTLPNTFGNIIPESFNFSTASVVPAAFLKPNNYDAITSDQLDKIWANGADFSSLDSFNDSKRGIMRASLNNSYGYPTDRICFLFKPTPSKDGSKILYEMYKWNGTNPSPDTNYPYYANVKDGKIYEYLPELEDFAASDAGALSTILSGYSTIIVFDEMGTSGWTTGCDPNVTLDKTSQNCAMKAALSLSSELGSLTNYDGINIPDNVVFANTGKYTISNIGTKIIIHPAATDVSGLLGQGG